MLLDFVTFRLVIGVLTAIIYCSYIKYCLSMRVATPPQVTKAVFIVERSNTQLISGDTNKNLMLSHPELLSRNICSAASQSLT